MRSIPGIVCSSIRQRLEPWRVHDPVVVAEPGVHGACGGGDEMVECHARAVVQRDVFACGVNAMHLGLQHCQPPAPHLAAQDVAHGGRDGRRRQAGSGHLVLERLEQVVVAAVDERDVDLAACQSANHRCIHRCTPMGVATVSPPLRHDRARLNGLSFKDDADIARGRMGVSHTV